MKTSKQLPALLLFMSVFTTPIWSAIKIVETTASQLPIKVVSEIEQVTVYLNGAEITRNTIINLKPGVSTLLFDELSSDIDENSIQISGLDDATILSINYGINYLSKPMNIEKVDSLKSQIDAIQVQMKQLKNVIDGLKKEEEILNSNQRLGSTTQEIDLEKVKELAAYYRQRVIAIRNAILDEQLKNEALQKQQSILQKQLNEFNVSEEIQSGEILLKINSDERKSLQLELRYTVKKAGWFPIYDIQATTINTPLSLEYKAHVFQNTGVSWENVFLELSTGDPNTNTSKPSIIPKYLNFVNPHTYSRNTTKTSSHTYKYNPTIKKVNGLVLDESGLPLPGANVIIKGTSRGTQTDFNGRYTLEVSEGEELQFSYVGFSSKELPIHASTMNVKLDQDNYLEEVVVTARGAKQRTEDIDVSEALINQTSGIIGSGTNIVIRGSNSSNENAKPLFIIDGLPVSSDFITQIDENDIISTDVLKGSSATSLYGSAGRNGVILITTKSGNITSEGIILEEGITNTRFKIEKQHTILSEEDVTVIKIDEFEVPATFEYLAVPVINENTFLTAKINQWEQFNLLPGEANIYFEGSYSGKTFINPLAITKELIISLGIDPNVTIERKEKDNFKSKPFLGNSRILDKAYTITVKNNKKTTISLTLFDRIPVSQNREIKVNDIQTYDAEYESKTGQLKWVLELTTGASIEKELSYELRFPRNKSISL